VNVASLTGEHAGSHLGRGGGTLAGDHRHRNSCLGEPPGDRGADQPAAHDHDIDSVS
jgi:hypothetical protein